MPVLRYGVCLLALILASCQSQRVIYPLLDGETALGIQAGGPVVRQDGKTRLIPLSSIHVARGFASGWTADVGLHTTALAYGTIDTDPGLQKTWRLAKGAAPGFNSGLRLNTMAGLRGGPWRLYPQIDLCLWWQTPGSAGIGYLGVSHWFDPYAGQVRDPAVGSLWRPAVYAGGQYRWNAWDLLAEARWMAPGTDNRLSPVEYLTPAPGGAIGVFLSVQYRFL